MIRARRLSFQLTPLLDLLLIVIFAQYIDVQETARRTELAARRQVDAIGEQLKQHASATARLQTVRESAAAAQAQLEREMKEAARRAAENEQDLVKRVAELTASLEEARLQRDIVGEMVKSLFDIPQETVDETLRMSAAGEQARPEETVQRVKQLFRQLATSRADEIVQHLLTYNELRKRCDIWDVYISETGVTHFFDGRVQREFRAPTGAAFEKQLFGIYKSLPEPKGLVVILVSYGDARFQWRQAALEGLPPCTERMRADSNGRTQFEFANLGFRPRTANTEPLGERGAIKIPEPIESP